MTTANTPSNATPDALANIAAHVDAMAAHYPHKRAVVVPVDRDAYDRVTYAHLTFAQLRQQVDRYAHGLTHIGLQPGMRTILMVRPGLEFFALTFALFKVGAVPVLIDPGIGRPHLVRCLSHVRAAAFIGIPLAHLLRTLYRRAFRDIRIPVTVGTRYAWGGFHLSDIHATTDTSFEPRRPKPGEPAAILFTSGSTGAPKGVIYEHAMFNAQVNYLHTHYGYNADDVDLATFPLFALFDAALGVTAVIPDMDATRPGSADPVKLVEAISDHGCTQMFGSPALLRRLARHGQQTKVKLPSLKRIITAGAPIAPRLLEQLRPMLNPDARIHTPYGATESLPVADIADDEILGETAAKTALGAGTCVGRPLPDMDVRVIEITDESLGTFESARQLPANQIGEIAVSGPVTTLQYFSNPTANAAAKIHDPQTDRTWHRMGDLGYFDDHGRLWFCGRKAHRVRTESDTLYTIPCEAIFNAHPQVARTALVGVGQPGRARPVLCVECDSDAGSIDEDRLASELLDLGAQHEHTRAIRTVLFHPGFPVDVRHNAKIFREKLALWAAEKVK